MFRQLKRKLSYEIELVTQLLAVALVAIEYGVMEGKWIDTGQLALPLFGRWSWYHVGLVCLMATVSFIISLNHIQWMLKGRRIYMFWASFAGIPLALFMEDLTWFVVRWQPIARDEWTMMTPGLGLNIGITWIPLWYFIALAVSGLLLWLSNRAAGKAFAKFKTARKGIR